MEQLLVEDNSCYAQRDAGHDATRDAHEGVVRYDRGAIRLESAEEVHARVVDAERDQQDGDGRECGEYRELALGLGSEDARDQDARDHRGRGLGGLGAACHGDIPDKTDSQGVSHGYT